MATEIIVYERNYKTVITPNFHGNQVFCNIWNTFEMKDGFSPASGFLNFKLSYGAIQVLRNAICMEIGPPPTPS